MQPRSIIPSQNQSNRVSLLNEMNYITVQQNRQGLGLVKGLRVGATTIVMAYGDGADICKSPPTGSWKLYRLTIMIQSLR